MNQLNYSCSTFDESILSFKAQGYKNLTFPTSHRLFQLLLGYIASHLEEDINGGYSAEVIRSNTEDRDENPLSNTQYGRIMMKIGYGEYKFRALDGEVYHAVYQHLGVPVASDCGGPDLMQNLVVFTHSLEKFGLFLSELVNLSEKPEEGKFICFTWLVKHCFWREDVRVSNRPVQSVVLPNSSKSRLLNDVEKFLSPKTKDFYARNGIPYRRSYLFHGVPGTGKTSMVQALAGQFKRNVCFLLPTHPEMTDDSLRDAIQSIPQNSIVVFEDIDSLFTKNRDNKNNKSALTFSGLLNALDGIGSPNGQIFVLTTNLREHLDNALIRNGRVDLHIEFTYAIEEQMEQMWKNFYPSGDHLAGRFASTLVAILKEKDLQVTTSTLQHFFIMQMDSTPEEALTNIETIVESVLQNSSNSMLNAARKSKKNNKKEGKTEEVKSGNRGKESNEDDSSDEFVVIASEKDTSEKVKGVESEGESKKKRKRNRKNRKDRNKKDGDSEKKESTIDKTEENLSSKASVDDESPREADESSEKKKDKKPRERKNKKPVIEVMFENGKFRKEEKSSQEEKASQPTETEKKVDSQEQEKEYVSGDQPPLPPRSNKKKNRANNNNDETAEDNKPVEELKAIEEEC
jgi:chaperone BCS1